MKYMDFLDAATLQNSTGIWAEKTFPKRSNESICNHLREEFEEFLAGEDPEEAADIVLLLMHHAHKNGYSLLQQAAMKLAKNKKRVWETEPNADGYYKHKECTCPTECDCEDYNNGLVSNLCPVHNDRPYPEPECHVHGENS